MPAVDPSLLVPVRTVYDEVYYVLASQFTGDREKLRCYHANGRPTMTHEGRRHVTDWYHAYVIRANLCLHDRRDWRVYKFPNGERMNYCPACRPDMLKEQLPCPTT